MGITVDELLIQLISHITSDNKAASSRLKQIKALLAQQKVTSTEEHSIDERYSSLAEKFTIKGHGQRAEALLQLKQNYIAQRGTLAPQRIHAYDMLALLLSLSAAPLSQPYTYRDYRQQGHTSAVSWQDIVQQEPFQGDHWQQVEDDMSSDMSMDSDDLAYGTEKGHQEARAHVATAFDVEGYYLTKLQSYSIEPSQSQPTHQLKRQQYWHVENADDQPPAKESRHGDTLLQDHNQLHTGLHQMGYITGMPKKYINEADVLREVLNMFRGCDTVLFKKIQAKHLSDVKFQYVPQYAIRHLSDAALRRLMLSFADQGSMIYKLRRHSSRSMFIRRNGQTFQAFLVAVAHHLQVFDAYLADLETRCLTPSAETISLLRLKESLAHPLTYFQALYTTLMQCSRLVSGNALDTNARTMTPFLLGTLFKQAMDANQTGTDTIANMMLDVFKQTLVPLARMVDLWVFYGSLQDDYAQEFFITRNTMTSEADELYWHQGYSIQGLDLGVKSCPLFASEFVERVLYVGKSVKLGFKLQQEPILSPGNTLMTLVEQTFPSNSPTFFASDRPGNMAPSMKQHDDDSNLLLDLLRTEKTLHSANATRPSTPLSPISSPCRVLMDVDLADCLDMYIHDHHQRASHVLLSLVLQRTPSACPLPSYPTQSFIQHIHTLGTVYLMLHTDFMHTFTDRLFYNMDTQLSRWYDTSFLNQTFTDAYLQCTPTFCRSHMNQFTLQMNSTHRINIPSHYKAPSTATYLEQLQINYQVPSPMHYFLQKEDVTSYKQVLQLVLRLKRAKYTLEKKAKLSRPTSHSDSVPSAPLYTMRMRLLWYINALWRYILITILDSETRELQHHLANVTGIDELVRSHKQYLARLLDKCLLNDKYTSVRKAILHILDLAEQLAELLVIKDTLAADSMAQSIALLQADFERTSDFIATSVSFVGSKGGVEWFQVLASSLSF
ncbi:hypothetical protein DM01DRAFT_1386820 [Hesseltinella vesiculosa]|uniref:Spindle pole body component n=1 Tax=Hesseltinella vesiculosa TaxID=101127 RepID=A0A1X2G4A4_9FUNG|nr:hypothetical protein DM01DRAFT_1386820 [Hesseltinella vesiculosa]